MQYWFGKLVLFFVAAEHLCGCSDCSNESFAMGMQLSDCTGEYLMPYWFANLAGSLQQLSVF
jgi:hypothetical protein